MASFSGIRGLALALPVAIIGLIACGVAPDQRTTGAPETTGQVRQALSNAVDYGCLGVGGATYLPPGDDVSSNDVTGGQPVALPFALNYFGTPVSSLVVGNNGILSLDGSHLATKTPVDLDALALAVIAPFWADVNTTGSTGAGADAASGGTVMFCSQTFVDEAGVSRNAFSAIWRNVQHAGFGPGNTFQVILVDRSADGQPGEFDIVFNYEFLYWESGPASAGVNGRGGFSARAGYSSSAVIGRLELPGSGVNDALLDQRSDFTFNPFGLSNTSHNSAVTGRHVFPVRGPISGPSATGAIKGFVRDASTGAPIPSAKVDVCNRTGTSCTSSFTTPTGAYFVGGLRPGSFTVTATAPDAHIPASADSIGVTHSEVTVDLQLTYAGAPPAGTAVPTAFINPSTGVATQRSRDPISLVTHGCADGTASYSLTFVPYSGPVTTLTGSLANDGTGTYAASVIPPLVNGHADVAIAITCPRPRDSVAIDFDINLYIDPSGNVLDTKGTPIQGATVTLYRVDPVAGSRTVVPDGSVIMSPDNRRNPDLTTADGYFRWDTTAGFYQVSAQKEGCYSADTMNPGPAFFTSVVQVSLNNPVTGLVLVLSCPNASVIDSLKALLPTGDKSADARIRDAINELSNVDGSNPFDADASAVASLASIKNPVAAITSIIQEIVERARAMAQAAIDRAIQGGGNAQKIAQAQKAIADAQEQADSGHFSAAVDKYGNAWLKASSAWKH